LSNEPIAVDDDLTGLVNEALAFANERMVTLARALGVSNQTIYNWLYGKCKPHPAKLAALKAYVARQGREY
jgi:hypothetical protein